MLLGWFEFAVCVLIMAVAGYRLARYGDAIAEKTGLGGVWIGAVLLAFATSLPEVFTGISAVTFLDAPDLTIGDLFGANTFNLFNLALLDIFHRGGPLFTTASRGHLLTAGLCLILVTFVAACLFVGARMPIPRLGWIGIYTPIILLLYLIMVRVLFKHEQSEQAGSKPRVAVLSPYKDMSLVKVYLYYAVAAIFVIGAGTWLAFLGEEITLLAGWERSFVGSFFIGFSTTVPEMTVSFSALRLGAIDLCIGNMVGSTLINMGIIGVVDLFYRQGPILGVASQSHVFTALVVILMISILVIGLILRPQHKTPLRASWYALALMTVFFLGSYISFLMA